jgi:hypothetical protein
MMILIGFIIPVCKVEYQCYPSMRWKPSLFEACVGEQKVRNIPNMLITFEINTPDVSPLKYQNGLYAVRAAFEALAEIFDGPIYHGSLFQPVFCRNLIDATSSSPRTCLLVDGVIQDPFGLMGLSVLQPELKNKRIVNMILGGCGGPPPGPSRTPRGIHAAEVVSMSIKILQTSAH